MTGAVRVPTPGGECIVESEAISMLYRTLTLAIDVMRAETDLMPDGIVVPASWKVAAIFIAAADAGFVHREGSVVHIHSARFIFEGVPIFFAGSDEGIEPFAISRMAHKAK